MIGFIFRVEWDGVSVEKVYGYKRNEGWDLPEVNHWTIRVGI